MALIGWYTLYALRWGDMRLMLIKINAGRDSIMRQKPQNFNTDSVL